MPQSPEDVRLMQLVAQGDPRARNLVAMRLCARVRRVQRGLLADLTDADDATQDSLVEILRSAGSFQGRSSLERWADRIAVRTGLRFRRARKPTSELAQDVAVIDDYGLGDQLPRPLPEYLAQIPLEERRALFLKHALGYTVPEVAAMTETAQSTVKFRIANALARLRKAIRRDCNVGVHERGAS